MHYQMIGIDLDGTLLDPDKRLTPRTVRAIEQAVDAGALVVPTTGRAWHMAHHVALRHLPPLKWGAFLDGATICAADTGRIRATRSIEAGALHQLAALCVDHPITWDLCRLTPDGLDYDYAVFGPAAASELEQWDRHQVAPHRLTRDSTLDGRACLVALLRSDDASVIEAAQANIERHDLPLRTIRWRNTLTDQGQGTHVLQLHSTAVDKWQGLCDIADRRGIPRKRIAVIGDEINDVTMVREAVCGIAMGNAIDAVKAVADHLAPANSDDGVAHALERLQAGAW